MPPSVRIARSAAAARRRPVFVAAPLWAPRPSPLAPRPPRPPRPPRLSRRSAPVRAPRACGLPPRQPPPDAVAPDAVARDAVAPDAVARDAVVHDAVPPAFHAWRRPRWLLARHVRLQHARRAGAPPPALARARAPPPPAPPRRAPLRALACAAGALAALALLWLSYARLNSFVARGAAHVAQRTLNRRVVVGRVSRCNPFTGVTLKDVHLVPSEQQPTAPVISAASLHVRLTGFAAFLLRRKPLALDVVVNRAHVRLAQLVVPGPKGLPVSQWDPGNYEHLLNSGARASNRDSAAARSVARLLRFVQPGKLLIKDSFVRFVPADFLDYGHASEVVDVRHANALVTFPNIAASQHPDAPFSLEGDFDARVRGTPVDGGTIEMHCFAKGSTLLTMQPEDVALTLRVKGERVRAAGVASFLSMPFRADQGRCAADISMHFLYKSKSLVPIMTGQATLHDVALRFHPDPKTPEFHNINGKLRFEGKTLFFERPVGELGSLPMTMLGHIHLEDGYNLTAYAHQVDVNNILDTFDVDKFVPVEGQVKGEAHMTGVLEEPVVRGCAQSVGESAAFDRLPLSQGRLSFEWDAIAGLLKFSDITASVTGGGSVVGEGTLFFDMTKPSPYGISRAEHSPRTPKALYWNSDADASSAPPLLPLPEDPLEIDQQAPLRPYDSMMFNFKVSDVDGGNLLRWYGGKYGGMATKSIGLVSGEGVLAGHAKDANCRVVWKSTTPPPEVMLNPEPPTAVSDGQTVVAKGTEQSSKKDKEGEDTDSTPIQVEKKGDGAAVVNVGGQQTSAPPSGFLGGGSFRGLVYMKLGDPPEARRVKVRTVVDGFDARRAGWTDEQLQDILCHFPLLEAAADTYFKGVLFQRAILPPGATKMPRTPRMELLGADGALAVRNLSLNKVVFPEIMTGSFSFSASDFSLSLRERDASGGTGADGGNGARSPSGDQESQREVDELTVSASLKGNAFLRFRRGSSAADANLYRNERGELMAVVGSKNLEMHKFIESSSEPSSPEMIRGAIDLSMGMNVSRRKGKGSIVVHKPAVGKLSFSSVAGEVLWRDQNLFLRRGTMKYRRSEYRISAGYELPLEKGGDFKWNVNVKIHRALINDIAQLMLSGNSVARALQTPVNRQEQGRIVYAHGPVWMQRLWQSHESDGDGAVESWQVPEDVSFPEQVAYYRQMMVELDAARKQGARKKPYARSGEVAPTLADISGEVTGIISLKYDSKLGEVNTGASATGALLQAALDQLAKTCFSFKLVGSDWMVDDVPIDNVQASGLFEDGVLEMETIVYERQKQFGGEVGLRVTSAGSVQASAVVDNVPAGVVNRFVQAPVDIDGNCSGRVQVEGNVTNPRALGRLVWTNAWLNGKRVRGAKTDVACVNGRCLLNVKGRIGGGAQQSGEDASDTERLSSLFWNDRVMGALQDLAKRTGSKFEAGAGAGAGAAGEWGAGEKGARGKDEEGVAVRVSAPVRFYLRRYVERRASSAFWALLEPVLGGAYPIDDEWIVADVKVKKHGLLLLNTVVPELGWQRGESDMDVRVGGTLGKPVVTGRVTVSDGRVWPSVLAEPLHSLRGEVTFNENGLMSVKHLHGRCAGKWLSVSGDMFLSESHRAQVEAELSRWQQIDLTKRRTNGGRNKKRRRWVSAKINFAKSCLSKASRGVNVEFGDIPINVENALSSRVSAKVDVKGTVTRAEVQGTVTVSDGEVVLSNAGSAPGSAGAGGGGGGGQGVGAEGVVKRAIGATKVAVGNEGEGGKGRAAVHVRKLAVVIGRGMRVVQPLVLNVEVSGKVEVEGTAEGARTRGEINFGRGTVNVLASRMRTRRGERSFVRVGGEGRWSEVTAVQVALEDDNYVVRVAECAPHSWMEHVSVEDKRGGGGGEGDEGEEGGGWRWPRAEAGELGLASVRRVLENYASEVLAVGGRAGGVQWKLFPTVAEAEGGGGSRGVDVRRQLAAAVQVEAGGVTLRAKRSVGGVRAVRVALRLLRALSVHVEADGARLRAGCALLLRARDARGAAPQ